MSAPRKVFLSPLNGVDPRRYSTCLLGPLILGVSLGVQLTAAALLLWGPGDSEAIANQLTEHGRLLARPEHDLSIFVGGAGMSILAALLCVWYWRAKLDSLSAANLTEAMTASALLQGVLGAASFALCFLLAAAGWFSRDPQSAPNAGRPALETFEAAAMLIPGMVALFCAVFDLEKGWLGASATPQRFQSWRRIGNRLLLFATPVFILLVIGVPPGRWGHMADQFLAVDWHHHLNFYFMGPALQFNHGQAFGTDIYSQYGVGWPLVACLLAHFSALSYGTLIGVEIVYVCIYYVAFFFLLRKCLNDEVWATLGTALAICWQIFSGMNTRELIWIFPSSTAMRTPMDVWFFMALVAHQRSGKWIAAAAAGAFCALGVIFETETGLYLLVTFFVYLTLQAGLASNNPTRGGIKDSIRSAVSFCGAGLLVSFPILLYASRGTLFTHAFRAGWMEAFVDYAGQGLGALPIAELPDAPFSMFVLMITLYLGIVAFAAVGAWHRSLNRGTVLLATTATYGMALLLLFVNRSHPFNLSHAAAPCAAILAAFAATGCRALQQRGIYSSWPWIAVCGLAALILLKPEFQRYPSCLRSCFDGAPSGRATDEDFPAEFGPVSEAIRTLAPDGHNVGILDFNDTALYFLSNTQPWSRYASLFHMMLTQEALNQAEANLNEHPPRYVVIRGKDHPRPPSWEFAWAPLYEIVTKRYHLRQTTEPYEIWELTAPAAPGK